MALQDEQDLTELIKKVIRAELGANWRPSKVLIDSAYASGNPKIQRPGESAPGGSDDAKKIIRPILHPTAGGAVVALQVGNDLVILGDIGDVPATSSDILGDGSDGAGNITGTTTLTRPTFYTTLAIGAAGILQTAGYPVFVQGAVTTVSGAIIRHNGAAGNAGGGGGTAAAAGYYRGGGDGGSGGNSGAGTNGTSVGAPTAGGAGGAGEASGAAAGSGGTVTAGDVHWKHSPYLAFLRAWSLSSPSAGTVTMIGGGGGGGGGGSGSSQAAGGGGGGGVVAIFAHSISIVSGAFIQANGGAGGAAAGGTGDGGGGGGGCVLLVYRSYSNAGTVQAAGGAAGGTGATAGSAGSIVQVPLIA